MQRALVGIAMAATCAASCVRAGFTVDARASDVEAPGDAHGFDGMTDAKRVLLQEPFSGPVSLGVDGNGNWGVSGGLLQQTSCALVAADSALLAHDFGDASVSVRVRVDQVCGLVAPLVGLTFRVASYQLCDNRYYACIVEPAGKLGLAVFKGSCILHYSATQAVKIDVGVWYQLTATAKGSTLCRLEGGVLPGGVSVSWQDSDPIPSGTVGFMAGLLAASFDDLVVRSE